MKCVRLMEKLLVAGRRVSCRIMTSNLSSTIAKESVG